MAAADDESDEDGNASDDNSKLVKDPRAISGDDLGDNLEEEVPRTRLGWIGEILRKKEGELESEDAAASGDSESEEDDGESEGSDDGEDEGNDDGEDEGSDEYDEEQEKAQTIKDWEQSDDDIIDTELEDDDGGLDEAAEKVLKVKDHKEVSVKGKQVGTLQNGKDKVKATMKHQQGELPYTIEAPKTLEEFTSLLDNCSDDRVIEAIRRIRTFNAIKIAAENRKKMQVFYGVLVQYFAVLANKKPLNFKLLNLLVKPLMEMSAEIPYFAAICARQRLQKTRTQFCEDLKNTGKSSWPSLKTLFLLRLWSMIFPCSDFRHCVMTPTILLMCEYLMRCPIIIGRDMAIASFLCSLLLCAKKMKKVDITAN